MKLDAEQLSKLLEELDACYKARQWVSEKTLSLAWRTCYRADWMLWLVGKMADKQGWPTHKEVVLATCNCAETALKYVKVGEDRPRLSIETTRKWVRGEVGIKEVIKASYAAYDAYDAYDGVEGAYAAAYAAHAFYAAVYPDTAYTAYYAYTKEKTLRELADLVRTTIKFDED